MPPGRHGRTLGTTMVPAGVVLHGGVVDRSVIEVDEPLDRGVPEPSLVGEVAVGDELSLGMRRQPAGACAQELLDLVVANPVVLGAIEHRQQDVQVVERIDQTDAARQGQDGKGCGAPVGASLIQCDGVGLDGPSHRGEQALEQVRDSGHRGQRDRQVEREEATSSSWFLHCPLSAVQNTLPIATASREDATYGRSLTY